MKFHHLFYLFLLTSFCICLFIISVIGFPNNRLSVDFRGSFDVSVDSSCGCSRKSNFTVYFKMSLNVNNNNNNNTVKDDMIRHYKHVIKCQQIVIEDYSKVCTADLMEYIQW